jgi:hypothetical protein
MITQAKSTGLSFDPAVAKTFPSHADPMGILHKSKTWMYALTKSVYRPIGQDTDMKGNRMEGLDPTQSVHASVLERWRGDASYRPRRLEEFFKKTKAL